MRISSSVDQILILNPFCRKRLCTLTLVGANGLDLRAYLDSYTESKDVLGERILDILEACWQQRDADGVIAEPDKETGCSMDSIGKVTAKLRYVKDLAMRGRPEETVEVTLTEYGDEAKSTGMHISLDLINMEEDEDESFSAEEIVSKFELLRDCWVQLTDGLEVEELVEEAEELGEEVEELGGEGRELGGEGNALGGEGKERRGEGKELGEEVQELGEEGKELGEEEKELGEEGKALGGGGKELGEEVQELGGEGKELGGEGKELGGGGKELGGEGKKLVEEMVGLVVEVKVEETTGEKMEKGGE